MIQKEIIDKKIFDMKSTLVVMFNINYYNPNLQIMVMKNIAIEFFEDGGLYNLEHSYVVINMYLYRVFGF